MTLSERFPLGIIEPVANLVLGYVRQIPGVAQATIAGSIRRMRDTVGDIDILIEAEAGADIIAQFLRFPDIAEALSKGPVRASVRLKSGLQVDVRLVVPAVHGALSTYCAPASWLNGFVGWRQSQRSHCWVHSHPPRSTDASDRQNASVLA